MGIGDDGLRLCRIGTAMGGGEDAGASRAKLVIPIELNPGQAIFVQVTMGFNPRRLHIRRIDLVAEVAASHAKWYRSAPFAHRTRDGSGGGKGQAIAETGNPSKHQSTISRHMIDSGKYLAPVL
jgi:hypothetical protein